MNFDDPLYQNLQYGAGKVIEAAHTLACGITGSPSVLVCTGHLLLAMLQDDHPSNKSLKAVGLSYEDVRTFLTQLRAQQNNETPDTGKFASFYQRALSEQLVNVIGLYADKVRMQMRQPTISRELLLAGLLDMLDEDQPESTTAGLVFQKFNVKPLAVKMSLALRTAESKVSQFSKLAGAVSAPELRELSDSDLSNIFVGLSYAVESACTRMRGTSGPELSVRQLDLSNIRELLGRISATIMVREADKLLAEPPKPAASSLDATKPGPGRE